MSIRDNNLLKFNALMLISKREVIDSFEEFIRHHQEPDNEEGYSDEKRKVLLRLCDDFLNKIRSCNIPSLYKPWYCYEYSLTNDSIQLNLVKYEEVLFNEEGDLEEATSTIEYTIIETRCEYLTVEEYSELYGVTTTTVRQWIRRGKLRTAKKTGRDWLIPELADTPKRGYDDATYDYTSLPEEIEREYPFLNGTTTILIYQDEKDKKVFHVTNLVGGKSKFNVSMTKAEREKLELMLISSPDVNVDTFGNIMFMPYKKNYTLPLLCKTVNNNKFDFDKVIVRHNDVESIFFYTNDTGSSYSADEPEEYILPLFWEFFYVPDDDEDVFFDVLDSENFDKCKKIGTMRGYLILCEDIISEGYDPWEMCDDISGELEAVMTYMISETGPLNEENGDSYENILYISELDIDGYDIKSRILQELPYMCRKIMHIKPDILSYYISDFIDNKKSKQTEEFYTDNGFQRVGASNLLYAYTDM